MNPKISAIVAIGKDRVIGNNNMLLWHISKDLKRFKEKTLGHPIIMGRKTFESILSILGKALPGRTNIVVTRQKNFDAKGGLIARSITEAIDIARSIDNHEIFIGGGEQIYKECLPFTDRLYLTIVNSDKKGDAFFPSYENIFKKEIEREEKEENGINFIWLTLEK